MAIPHVQHLLVVLASLFVIPAFCNLDFEYCNQSGYDWGNITLVEYDRLSTIPTEFGFEPAIKITVYGSTNNASNYIGKVHNEYVELDLSYYGHARDVLDFYNLCDLIACPIKPGTNFVLTFPKVEYHPAYSFDGYRYEVNMYDDNRTVFMCVSVQVPNLALTLVSAS